jgi:hypothetical protein
VFLSRLQDDWSKGATEHCDRRKILGLPQVKSTPEVSKVNAALLCSQHFSLSGPAGAHFNLKSWTGEGGEELLDLGREWHSPRRSTEQCCV